MNDVTLISVDDVKEATSISDNIDSRLLEPYLEVSEGFYCTEILGDALVTQLKNQITGNTLTELNQYLLKSYVRPLIAYGVWHDYLPFSAVKTQQKGEVRETGDNENVATLEEITYKRNALKDKITFYQRRLRDYLDKNTNNYPLYRSSCNSGSTGGVWQIYLGNAN